MVKKFFRKIFKKDVPQPNDGQDNQHSSLSQNHDFSSDNQGDEDLFSEEVNLDSNFSTDEFDQLPTPNQIDDLPDLPDLPKEVLKAIQESSVQETPHEFSAEDSDDGDEFNFTEIKPVHQGLKNDKDEMGDEINFEFNELKVDLPKLSKKNKVSAIFHSLQELIKNLNPQIHQDQSSLSFLNSHKKTQIHQIFVIILISCTCYYSGKLIAYLLGGQEVIEIANISSKSLPKNKTREEITNLEKLNPFDALLTSKKPEDIEKNTPKKIVIDENKICEKSTKNSSLKIEIETVIVLQDRIKSIAAIKVKNKSQYIREGEKIEGMARIGAINLDKVIFRNLQNGFCEYIATPDIKKTNENKTFAKMKIHPAEKAKEFLPTDPNIKVDGNNYKIDSKIRNEILENITDVLSQARAVQIKNSDGSLSFKIVEIVPGSIYSKLNIQENDIITKINGDKIDNLNDVMSLFGRIKDLKNLELGIERDGIENDFQYSFE